MRKFHRLALTIAVACFPWSGYADKPGQRHSSQVDWYACEVATDCVWLVGEGGWPAVVRTDSEQAYRRWVESQAPFTTYFMPGDCFRRAEEFEAYLLQSKSRVACVEHLCKLTAEPECTK